MLVNANSFPFMRFKKPQSPFLSRVLRDKVRQKNKRFFTLAELEYALDDARSEDDWDVIVSQARRGYRSTRSQGRVGFTKLPTAEPAWKEAVEGAMRYLQWQLKVADEKRTALSQKMYEIIEKEKELAKKEKLERSKLRKASRVLEGGV